MAGRVAELEAYRTGARALAARILSAQEGERVRVSRELHDDTGQALTLLLVRLQLVGSMTDDPKIKKELAELRELVGQTLDGVRRLAVQLGPSILEDLGLRASLEWLVDRVHDDSGLDAQLVASPVSGVPSTVALAVYRVAQEALTNVVRHARATAVEVVLDEEAGHLRLVVADDGSGFDVAAAQASPSKSVGLFGMAERAALVGGSIAFTSRPGIGSRVELRVPLREEIAT